MLTASSSFLLRPAACCCMGRGRKQRHGGNSRTMKEATFTRGLRKTTAFGDKQGRESDYIPNTVHCIGGKHVTALSVFSRHPPSPLPSSTEYKLLCTVYRCSASPACREWWWWTSIVSPSGNRYITPFAPLLLPFSVRKLDTPLFDSLSRPLHPPSLPLSQMINPC